MFEQYKRAIIKARELEQMGVLFLIYDELKVDWVNDKITEDEYNKLRKMILGL